MKIPFLEIMIVWVVRVDRTSCVHQHLGSAIEDWKTHDGWRWLYPKLMTPGWFFRGLKDFEGW